jgi:glucose-6-phosphate 1-dehydrogenase
MSASDHRQIPRSDALVLFGATGDLAKKKIFPAVYEMEKAGVNNGVPVVGVASSEWDDDQLRNAAHEAITANGAEVDEVAWKALAGRMTYVSGDYREAATFQRLAECLAGVERPLFYLAIPPSMFDDVVQGLAAVGLNGPGSRVVVEKPFGRDLTSARELTTAPRAARAPRHAARARRPRRAPCPRRTRPSRARHAPCRGRPRAAARPARGRRT